MENPLLFLEFISRSPADTAALGRRIGRALSGGLVLTLSGDLGSGKTALVQGLAAGLQVPDSYYVTSPTYTIINEYPGRMPLFHIDLYRISDPEGLEDLGIFDLLQPPHVVAIEWPDIIADELPSDRLAIVIAILGDATRKISLGAYGLQARSMIERLDLTDGQE